MPGKKTKRNCKKITSKPAVNKSHKNTYVQMTFDDLLATPEYADCRPIGEDSHYDVERRK